MFRNQDGGSTEEVSNWAILEELWPRAQRPKVLQAKANVLKLPFDHIMCMHKSWLEQGGAKSLNSSNASDGAPNIIKFKTKVDNSIDKLHGARWMPLPMSDMKSWYPLVPIQRTPVIKSLPLEFSGAQFAVGGATIELLHNRTNALSLKQFSVNNFNISNRPKRESTTCNEGKISRVWDYDWEEMNTVAQAQEALVNFLDLNHSLWPMDKTAIIMMKIMFKYKWIIGCQDPRVRKEIISGFFGLVTRQNSIRALNGKAPLDYESQEKALREIMEKAGQEFKVPLATIPRNNGNSNQSGSNNRNNGFGGQGNGAGGYRGPAAGGQGGEKTKRFATFQGKSMCWAFNNKERCNNKLEGNFCRATNGTQYAHLCNVYNTVSKTYCLKPHNRQSHRY